MSQSYADRPAHHLDNGFTNPGYGSHSLPSLGVTVPFFWRRMVSTVTRIGPGGAAPARIDNDGSVLRAYGNPGTPTVTWVGHSTLLVQMDGVSFLTDPVWSETASPAPVGPRRYVDPGLDIAELPPIDFVLISHNHYDHLDLTTLERLVGGGTRFLVPLANAELLEDYDIGPAIELDWWESVEIAGVHVYCVPARHWSRRGLFDTDRALWSGWVVVGPERRFYFAGDTGLFDGFAAIGERLGPFDLAAVPIGAYCPEEMMAPAHVNPEEAVVALERLGARKGVAIHYGTFDLSDEPLDEPPRRFIAASEAAGRGAERDWVMKVGETRYW